VAKDLPGVVLDTISVQPDPVYVGDIPRINAMIINNSSKKIKFSKSPCGHPLSLSFDRNMDIYEVTPCVIMPLSIVLQPGDKLSAQSPGTMGKIFRAIGLGLTKATVRFDYHYGEQPIYAGSANAFLAFTIVAR
jgi:hypothetical protein